MEKATKVFKMVTAALLMFGAGVGLFEKIRDLAREAAEELELERELHAAFVPKADAEETG